MTYWSPYTSLIWKLTTNKRSQLQKNSMLLNEWPTYLSTTYLKFQKYNLLRVWLGLFFFFQGMNAAMLHIGPWSRNDYLVKPMEKLAKESFIPERRTFQTVIWFMVCSICMFLFGSSAISSCVTDSNWCHMESSL